MIAASSHDVSEPSLASNLWQRNRWVDAMDGLQFPKLYRYGDARTNLLGLLRRCPWPLPSPDTGCHTRRRA